MRKRGVLAKADKDAALHAKIVEGGGAVAGEFLLSHLFVHRGPGRAVSNDRDVVGFLH